MYHYKIEKFECDEGDMVSTCYGEGVVVNEEDVKKRASDCQWDPNIWVYVDLTGKRIYGLKPDIHNVRVLTKSNKNVSPTDDADVCKKCGNMGHRFPMCCRCLKCGNVIWGI